METSLFSDSCEREPLQTCIEDEIKNRTKKLSDLQGALELIRKNPEVVELLDALRKVGY